MPEKIKTRIPTKEYEDNYDKIFGKKLVEIFYQENEGPSLCELCINHLFDEERMDIIGTNGNTGDHYALTKAEEFAGVGAWWDSVHEVDQEVQGE